MYTPTPGPLPGQQWTPSNGTVGHAFIEDNCTRIARRKWAPVFGLIGQPFWFYAAWTSQQWGIFALCFLYSLSWARGLRLWRSA